MIIAAISIATCYICYTTIIAAISMVTGYISCYITSIAAISMVTGYIPRPLAPPLMQPLMETESCQHCTFS